MPRAARPVRLGRRSAVVVACCTLTAQSAEGPAFSAAPVVYWQPQRYAPVSENTPSAERLGYLCRPGPLGSDDLAAFWLASRWKGFAGRDDLPQLRVMGVEAWQLSPCLVRQAEFQLFLDRAWAEGLTVVAELPRRLLLRELGGCLMAVGDEVGGDCYDIVRRSARQLLATDLVRDGEYHPAVEMILLARDLDTIAGVEDATTAILSTFDGYLDAEHEMGIVAGKVGIAALLAGAASITSRDPASCYHVRAPDTCDRPNLLRTLWSRANKTPGWQQPIAGQGKVHRGLPYVREPSGRRGDVQGSYVAHNDLGAAMASRWTHTFVGEATADNVTETLRLYYEFINPVQDPRPGSAVLLDLLPNSFD